jgi:hypothetical protein
MTAVYWNDKLGKFIFVFWSDFADGIVIETDSGYDGKDLVYMPHKNRLLNLTFLGWL